MTEAADEGAEWPPELTSEEAAARLPALAELLEQLVAARRDIRRLLGPLRAEVPLNGEAAALFAACRAAVAAQREIAAHGAILRDPDTGLVDFLGRRDDEQVWLCWRLGEALSIDWWHPIDRGVAHREPW